MIAPDFHRDGQSAEVHRTSPRARLWSDGAILQGVGQREDGPHAVEVVTGAAQEAGEPTATATARSTNAPARGLSPESRGCRRRSWPYTQPWWALPVRC